MNAGLLKHRIAIQKMTVTSDATGNQLETWGDYATAKAYVNGLSGGEYWAAHAQQAENTVIFTVRYTDKINQITPQGYLILFSGATYDIKHVDNVQYGDRFIKIKAVVKVG